MLQAGAHMIRRDGESIILADTITALPTRSAGRVVVSGSHGGKYPGYLAAKAGVRAVIFNEAGVGLHEAGRGSLPFLQSLGIAAGVVSSMSCRIGDASDMMQRGVISAANPLASALGVEIGQPCSAAAEGLTAADWNRAQVEPFGEARATLDLGRARRRIILVELGLACRSRGPGSDRRDRLSRRTDRRQSGRRVESRRIRGSLQRRRHGSRQRWNRAPPRSGRPRRRRDSRRRAKRSNRGRALDARERNHLGGEPCRNEPWRIHSLGSRPSAVSMGEPLTGSRA